ncbi:MAG TPA: TRAFs-binding domain-containing protein [Thermoanaerobaculia bacterium]
MGDDELRPICFMVMPFGVKPTGLGPGEGPARVDFQALWFDVLEPAIADLGYEPVRADEELGALIIVDMIQRLAISDLVIADISTANANVYYEIGVRHAAKPAHCVIIAADWAKPVFDLAQIRHITYKLPTEKLSADEAKELREDLVGKIKPRIDATGPVYEAVPGFPNADLARANAFAALVKKISAFQGKVKAAVIGEKTTRKERVLALAKEYLESPTVIPSVALELLLLVRDHAGWADVMSLVDRLPESVRNLPLVREQRALAIGKKGSDVDAIAALTALIQDAGESAERRGILGGRYKAMYRTAIEQGGEADAKLYLTRAIENYTAGMYLDLNEFYCSSNLPRLLRTRGRKSDEKLAVTAAEVTRAACERRQKTDPDDIWLGQTLLGQAADAADPERASELVEQIEDKTAPPWQLDTTDKDLQMSIALIKDEVVRAKFEALVERLRAI